MREMICRLHGIVVHGKGLGQKMGMPTANLQWLPSAPLPPDGVYAAQIQHCKNSYIGVVNVGTRPTVDRDDYRTVEAHLLDFSGDLYGEEIEIAFYHRLRDTQRFASTAELHEQFRHDCTAARAWFKKGEKQMKDILHVNINDLQGEVKDTHAPYTFSKATLVPRGSGKCSVSVYEIEPGKSNYPYHWHTENEEVFYIISGEGTLRTPEGERQVKAGDLLYFPPNPNGAHKLTNTGSETLKYIDFDTENEIAVTFYPDSNKMGVWGLNVNKVYKVNSNVDYYEGE